MNCQKCGASLPPGCLYCEKCGNEYQIVPNFEPEIENSMAESLSDVADSMADDQPNGLSASQPSIDNTLDNDMESRKIFSENKDTKTERSRNMYTFVTFFLIFLFLGAGSFLMYTNSVSYYKNKALKAEEANKYNQALLYYAQLRKKEPDNVYWYLEEARLELYLGNNDNALQLGYQAIENTAANSNAYRLVLHLLADSSNYQEAYRILQSCNDDEVKKEFKEYNSQVGLLNYNGGAYDEIIQIELTDTPADTYYTMDGSVPDRNAILYEKPIVLGRGTHTLSFIAYNEYGVASQIIRKEYIINTTTPLAPDVLPESGSMTDAEMIEIEVEEGCKVYYTTDGTLPTKNSLLYVTPIPIPLGESSYTFVAVAEDGSMGEYTYRNYSLSLKSNLSLQKAEQVLMEKLISTGHILDMNGAIYARYGVFRYFYTFPLSIDGKNYYVFEEHYLENLINNSLGNYYIVDVLTGEVFPLMKDFTGKYSRGYF